MTEFLESFATQQLLPPWKASKVENSCFMFRLPAHTIQAYLDRFFNFGGTDGAPFYFKAHDDLQHGLLIFQHYSDIWSVVEKDDPRGYDPTLGWDHLSYNQAYAAVPIVRYTVTAANLLADPQIYWIQPVVICNNSSVVYGSREIVGVDMMQGEVVFTQDSGSAGLHVDTYINGVEKFGPRSKEAVLPFVHVETGAPLAGGMPPLTTKLAAEFLMSLATVTHDARTVADSPLPQQSRLVTLKQFRDSQDMTRATYQAIVSSTSTMSNVTNLQFYDPASVDIDFMWSATANEILTSFLDLGTFKSAPAADARVKSHGGPGWNLPHKKLIPEVAFSFTADLDFTEIETLYTFGQRG